MRFSSIGAFGLAVFCAVCAAGPLFAQYDFSAAINKERANYNIQAADATYTKPVQVNPAALASLDVNQALAAAGSDLTSAKVMASHAKIYADVIDGKYGGLLSNKRHAVAMLGLLGSSNSPLVGNAAWIKFMLGRVLKTYSGASDLDTQATALVSMALIGGANYSMAAPPSGFYSASTVGEGTLNFLAGVVSNKDLKFNLRRAGVMALTAMHKNAAVAKITGLINLLADRDGDDKDKVFEITNKGEVEDYGNDDETLQASLMLALEEQLQNGAKDAALVALEYYATLSGVSCDRRWYAGSSMGIKMPEKTGVNKTTLLMARHILATRTKLVGSAISQTQNGSGKFFYKEVGPASCLIPVFEDESFKCATRKSFHSLYEARSAMPDLLYQPGNGPGLPYSFDNCLNARTQKLMFNIAADVLLGAAIEHLGLVAIRFGARYISSWSIDKAYKVVAMGGKLSTANKYAKFGGSIGEYGEITAHLWETYHSVSGVNGMVNTTRESLE